MAPLRRYLRITKHSVLEVRIYLDRPSDADGWLLKRDNPALPRVIQAIRPLVLPKLREENERAKGRAGAKARKKGVKDVVVEDDFEVSIFLTDHSSRHTVLTKHKIFKDKPRIQSNSGKLTSWLTAGTSDKPLVIDQDSTEPIIVREEDDDDVINLADIPEGGNLQDEQYIRTTRSGRRSAAANEEVTSDESLDESVLNRKRRRRHASHRDADPDHDDVQELQDDKKKFGINTSYDGFSIYGHILCLVVKRRGGGRSQTGGGGGGSGGVPISSQQMLEQWVSTQAAAEQVDDDEDNG